MAVILGKRKRPEQSRPTREIKPQAPETPQLSEDEDIQDAFRRAFEAKFKPLETVKKSKVEAIDIEENEEDDEEGSDWEGISEDEGGDIQVVEHVAALTHGERMTKSEMRAFMSAKPPTNAPTSTAKQKPTTSPDEEEGETLNLKNDLALQKLLRESHLLEEATSLSATGAARHKATDLHLQNLGSKKSLLVQEKMPMSHRKGISAKANQREAKRRQEAKENGIILEKAVMEKKKQVKRDRGVGAPAIGKFKGGTLKLSKRDVASIEGPKKSGFKKGKRR